MEKRLLRNLAGPGSVRFGYGLGMERFERFRFSVPAVPLRRVLLCVSVQFNREDGSGFGSWTTVPAVPVPRSVPGKTVPTVPVSGSVPGPPCFFWFVLFFKSNRARRPHNHLVTAGLPWVVLDQKVPLKSWISWWIFCCLFSVGKWPLNPPHKVRGKDSPLVKGVEIKKVL